MKQSILILSTLLIGITIYARNDADKILGVWLNDKEDAKIEIFKTDGRYFGKIVWLAEPTKKDGTPKTDLNNPDSELQKRKIMGLEIISNLKYDDGEWVDGKLYSPPKGEYVDCEMEISGNNKELYVTASKGLLFSKTVVWTKAGEE